MNIQKKPKKWLKIIVGAVILAIVIFAIESKNIASAPAPAITKPITPQPNIAIYHGNQTKKQVVLTFDADMTPKMLSDLTTGKIPSLYDKRITDTLEQNSVPATLFITGLWAEQYPEILKTLSENPLYEIGNHSWDHAAFHTPCYGLGETKNKQSEITKTQEILTKITGKMPLYFRFPGGCYDKTDVNLVSNSGMKVIDWDVISGDSYLKDQKAIVTQVLTKATNGSIIVLHLDGGPTSPSTALAVPDIIKGLKEKGFQFVSLSEILK